MSVRPFDAAKFRKSLTKSIPGISAGFRDPKTWIDTGSYTLNYLISGDFFKGVPLSKVTMFAGESGAAKSYVCSGTVVKAAQDQGIFVILIDTENALDEVWLHGLGVDTSDDKLLKLSMCMIDDVASTLDAFIKQYKEQPEDQQQKILVVIDSLSMLLSQTDVDQFSRGELKGDMGRVPKALKALVKNLVNKISHVEIGILCTAHTYASQDMFNPDDVITGGQGAIYASSIVVAMKKLKLKEDEDGNKTKTVNGIRAAVKIMKTRYAKPFETAQIKIPYYGGMSKYTGLFDLFESRGLLSKEGNSYVYEFLDGTKKKMFKKHYEENKDGILDAVMADYISRKIAAPKPITAQVDDVSEDE